MPKVLKPCFWSCSFQVQHAAFSSTFEITNNKAVFLFSSVFWPAYLLHAGTKAFGSLLDPSVPRLCFERLAPNIKIVPSFFFTYKTKVESVKGLKCLFLFFLWWLDFFLKESSCPFAQTLISQRTVKLLTKRETCGARWSRQLVCGTLCFAKRLLALATLRITLDCLRPDGWKEGQYRSSFYGAHGSEKRRDGVENKLMLGRE